MFRQTSAFAMQWGAVFGLYWCLGFLFMVMGVDSPAARLLQLAVMISAPFLGIRLSRHFERQVRSDAPVSFSRAYVFSLLMYFFASVVLAAVAYVYFSYFDHGTFIEKNIAQLEQPESQQILNTPQMKAQMDSMLQSSGFKDLKELLRSVTPTMFVANIIDINLIVAIILSVPTALLSKTRMSGTAGPKA